MINFVKYRVIYFIFSGILIIASLYFLSVFGLKKGIDFTGGSILEVEYQKDRPSNQKIEEQLKDLNLGEIILQPSGDKNLIIRMKDIDDKSHQDALNKLQGAEERRFESIGPSLGKELTEKSRTWILLSMLAMLAYIAFSFRRVSRPVPSWQYGIISIITLSHDILIPLGVFAILGKFYNVEFTVPIVTALLTVLGYAINDKIVVFDRIRENLLKRSWISFEETVNYSINQTLSRSINTSLTVLLSLFALFFFGGETLKYFSLALILGVVFGTYSSIFLASPMLVSFSKRKEKRFKS